MNKAHLSGGTGRCGLLKGGRGGVGKDRQRVSREGETEGECE